VPGCPRLSAARTADVLDPTHGEAERNRARGPVDAADRGRTPTDRGGQSSECSRRAASAIEPDIDG
jgi:hypothetical protein